MNERTEILATVMDEKEYLASKGLADPMSGWCLDKLRGNRQLRTERGRKRFMKEAEQAESEYQARRNEAKAEYARMLESGEARPSTWLERSLSAAHGHPDNESTQAARRMLAKRGYDWETGERLTA